MYGQYDLVIDFVYTCNVLCAMNLNELHFFFALAGNNFSPQILLAISADG